MSSTESNRSATPGRRGRLLAVMFADMVGYSRHMEQDEERSSAQTTRSVGLFTSLIGDYGGQVANVAGDGILALFDSDEQALRVAMQMQSEFREQSVWSDGEPIQFRIGLNLGEVMVNDGNVQGHCVNVAARLQAMAEPGSIVVTGAVRDAVRDHSGMSLRPLGRQAFKNISEAIEVFAVGQAGAAPARFVEAARAAPPAQPARHPSVAVLALANLSRDPANDHLCQGIAEGVIVHLSRFRSLMLIARRSAF